MSEALYRKYRPQTFEDVVGQAHIERTLKNAIESDKVSHAYLFCGPRGTGKTTTARLLAKALLCEHGPTPSPDGTCEQCLAIAEGTHPDVNELDAASRTGVENVREEIIGRVQFAPTQGRYKVYIIDEVHMLSTAAFNALLKTLEEPPSHVVFILCTTDPQKVPETIHSRCQRFDFHRLSNEEIVSRLGAVCMAEGIEFEGDALDLVAHRAQGGMRDALTALEQLAAFGNGSVTLEVAENVLGSLNTSDMAAIVEHIGRRDAAACFTWVSEYVETGADLAQFSRDLAEYIRNMYVTALIGGSVDLGISAAARTQMEHELSLFGTDRLAHILDVLGDLTSELRSSINPRLSFEIALTRMVRPDADLTIAALAARVEALEAALASGAQASAATAPAAAAQHQAPAASACRTQPQARSTAVPAALAFQPRAQAPAAPAGRPTQTPAASAPSTEAPRTAFESAPSASLAAAGEGASADVSAKLANPAALQRGWQATINDVKRQRTAYGALLLSAKIVPEADCSGVRIEFSANNTFAFGAVQRPDVSEILAASLDRAFGGPVPFRFTQASAAVSASAAPAAPVSAPVRPQSAPPARTQPPAAVQSGRTQEWAAHPSAPASAVAPAAPAQAPSPLQPAPWEDDVVPYDDADAFAYGYSDDDHAGPAAGTAPAAVPASAPSAAASSPGGGGGQPARPSAPSSAFPFGASAAPGSAAPAQPFASRSVPPSPASSSAPAPSAGAAEELDAAAIFGSLGVSFEEVTE